MIFDRRSLMKTSLAAAGASLVGDRLLSPRQALAAAPGPNVPAALVAAAKKEGAINVITLPRDWANWGVTMDRFQELYGSSSRTTTPMAARPRNFRRSAA